MCESNEFLPCERKSVKSDVVIKCRKRCMTSSALSCSDISTKISVRWPNDGRARV